MAQLLEWCRVPFQLSSYNFFLRSPQGIKQGFICSEMIWNQHQKILQKPNDLSH